TDDPPPGRARGARARAGGAAGRDGAEGRHRAGRDHPGARSMGRGQCRRPLRAGRGLSRGRSARRRAPALQPCHGRSRRGSRRPRRDGLTSRSRGVRAGESLPWRVLAGHLRTVAAAPRPTYREGMDNRAEVREFLMSRRAKLTPQQAGLPVGGSRRVPGLRRSEVADLAGVSVEYYAKLERGAIAGASASVLDALSRALQLDETERRHLLDLARAADGIPASGRARRPRTTSLAPVRESTRW